MATHPEPPSPGTTEPQSPPETPADPSPDEAPFQNRPRWHRPCPTLISQAASCRWRRRLQI